MKTKNRRSCWIAGLGGYGERLFLNLAAAANREPSAPSAPRSRDDGSGTNAASLKDVATIKSSTVHVNLVKHWIARRQLREFGNSVCS